MSRWPELEQPIYDVLIPLWLLQSKTSLQLGVGGSETAVITYPTSTPLIVESIRMSLADYSVVGIHDRHNMHWLHGCKRKSHFSFTKGHPWKLTLNFKGRIFWVLPFITDVSGNSPNQLNIA